MNRRETLLDRAQRNPNGLKFRDFKKRLRQCGWTQHRQRGITEHGIHPVGIASSSNRSVLGRRNTKFGNFSNNTIRRQQMKTHNQDDFDGFMINVFFDEDGDYLAHLMELPNVSAFGPTPAKALDELKISWELMKECYHKDGEPIPTPPSRDGYEGPFNVLVDAQLYM